MSGEFTIGAIAREFGVSNAGVLYWVNKLDLKPRTIPYGRRMLSLLSAEDKERIRECMKIEKN